MPMVPQAVLAHQHRIPSWPGRGPMNWVTAGLEHAFEEVFLQQAHQGGCTKTPTNS